jgi:hypothetical protein
MRTLTPIALSLAIAATGAVAAQDKQEKKDATATTRTEIDVDDGRAITMTGCLVQVAGQNFALRAASVVKSDEVTTKTRVERDVDDDGTEVSKSAKTEIDTDGDAKPVGTSGLVATYDLTARQGVELAPHVGKQVQVIAISLDPKDGDDDAKVEIEERTKIAREDAPDSEVRTRTEAEIPRGAGHKVAVVSVKPLGSACQQ